MLSGPSDSTKGGAGEEEVPPPVMLRPHLEGRGPDSHAQLLGTRMLSVSSSPSQSGPGCSSHLELSLRQVLESRGSR